LGLNKVTKFAFEIHQY